MQLSVPAIAAAGGIVLLNEALTLRLVLASIAILGGCAIVIWRHRQQAISDGSAAAGVYMSRTLLHGSAMMQGERAFFAHRRR